MRVIEGIVDLRNPTDKPSIAKILSSRMGRARWQLAQFDFQSLHIKEPLSFFVGGEGSRPNDSWLSEQKKGVKTGIFGNPGLDHPNLCF